MKKRFIFSLMAVVSLYIVGCKKSQTNDAEFSNAPKDLAALYKNAGAKLKPYVVKDEQRAPGTGATGSTTFEDGFTDSIASDIITPLLNPTVNYLSQNYDIDLNDYFDSLNDPRIALVGQAVMRVEQLETMGFTIDTTMMGDEIIDPFRIPIYGRTGDVLDCALHALGVHAAKELLQAFSDVAKKELRRGVIVKMIKQVASKYLSWVGVAIMAYDFGHCMEWW